MQVELKNISKGFASNQVLKNISLEITGGEIFCLLGKNGSGKSTLLNLLANLIEPDRGQVLINNKLYSEQGQRIKNKIGLLSEYPQLIEELNIFDFLQLTGSIYRMEKESVNSRAKSLIHLFFNDEDDLTKEIAAYSKGMKQKALLCAAILPNPDLLLLDEPFANLDPGACDRVYHLLKAYATPNRIIFFTSNNLVHAQKVSTRIGILNNGELIFQAKTIEFPNDGKTLEDIYYNLTKNDEAYFEKLIGEIR